MEQIDLKTFLRDDLQACLENFIRNCDDYRIIRVTINGFIDISTYVVREAFYHLCTYTNDIDIDTIDSNGEIINTCTIPYDKINKIEITTQHKQDEENEVQFVYIRGTSND